MKVIEKYNTHLPVKKNKLIFIQENIQLSQLFIIISSIHIKPLMPNVKYSGHTAPLTS